MFPQDGDACWHISPYGDERLKTCPTKGDRKKLFGSQCHMVLIYGNNIKFKLNKLFLKNGSYKQLNLIDVNKIIHGIVVVFFSP